MGTLLARTHWLDFLRFCGEHSIVIYLAFFLPMAATRTLLLQTGLIHDIGTISLIVTIAGVLGALAIWRIALAAGANFLFERPAAFWIAPKKPQRDVAGGGVAARHRRHAGLTAIRPSSESGSRSAGHDTVPSPASAIFTPSFMPSIFSRNPSASPKSAKPW